MLDFELQRCSCRCAATERELAPGDEYYSVLISQDGKVERIDYSAAAWPGPPENALGWWKSSVPAAEGNKIPLAPSHILLSAFEELQREPGQDDLCYVLALLLIRRKVFRLEETQTDEQGAEHWHLYCPRNEGEYRQRVEMPTTERIGEIQRQLSELLSSGEAS